MAITMPRSANHHQGEETPSVKYGVDFKVSEVRECRQRP